MLVRNLAGVSAFLAALMLAGCASQATTPTATLPTSESPPLAATSAVPNATAGILPPPAATAAPDPAARRSVQFSAADGTELHGQLFGAGPAIIVLSNMGDNDPEPWETFAPQLAARGYRVLTYSYRYPKNASRFDNLRARQTLDDLRGAIAFVHAEGAERIGLVGASLGGMVTAKAAAEAKADAVIVLAAPVDLTAFDFRVELAELAGITAPKLFIGAEDDRNVPFTHTQRMYDLSPEPKQIQRYSGSEHGVQLLAGTQAADLSQRLIDFLIEHVPPSQASRATGSAASGQDTVAQQGWRRDLQFLADRLRTRHPKPFYRTSEAAFEQAVQQLDADIPSLTRNQIIVGFFRIAAMIDGHTQMSLLQGDPGFHVYPLRLYWFSDGLFVTDAQEPYRDAIGARVVQIGALPTEQAATQLDQLASYDNLVSRRSVAPAFYLMPEVQVATGVAQPDEAGFTLEQADGKRITIHPNAITIADYLAWTNQHFGGLPARPKMLALSRKEEAFWFTTIQENQVVYAQYNQVRASTQSGETLQTFAQRLADVLDTQPVRRVVLDMRFNGGGNNTTYGPLLNVLRTHALFKQPNTLYVLIGRQTFSAAANFVVELEHSTMAVFAGEPTGGRPNVYGDTRPSTLPYSKLVVFISSRYWQKSTPDDTRDALEPQLAVALSSSDFFAERDAVLEQVLAQP